MTDKYKCNCDPNDLPEVCLARIQRYHRAIEFIEKISRIESENLRTNLQLRDEAKKILEEINE